jgi:isoquinoline 1-oxidoreductase beta subunit
MLGGGTGVIQSNAALAMPGVERLVLLPPYAGSTAGFAVVGKTSWHAKQGALAVDATWQQRPLGGLDSAEIQSKLLAAVNDSAQAGFAFYKRGDAQAELTVAASEAGKSARKRVIESIYTAPYLAHATMEPMNCTAQVKAGKVTIWVPTQVSLLMT